MGITLGEIDALTDGLAKVIKEELAKRDVRIAALEQRPEVAYAGTFEEGKSYRPGQLCTRSGSLWLCTGETNGTPGDRFCADFKLIVKRGQA